jgi:hypothetical protein
MWWSVASGRWLVGGGFEMANRSSLIVATSCPSSKISLLLLAQRHRRRRPKTTVLTDRHKRLTQFLPTDPVGPPRPQSYNSIHCTNLYRTVPKPSIQWSCVLYAISDLPFLLCWRHISCIWHRCDQIFFFIASFLFLLSSLLYCCIVFIILCVYMHTSCYQ